MESIPWRKQIKITREDRTNRGICRVRRKATPTPTRSRWNIFARHQAEGKKEDVEETLQEQEDERPSGFSRRNGGPF